jgi:two-component system chemotaxis response regulator CheY
MKILIIDDEMAALAKMKILLSRYGDCTLVTNGTQALQQCAKAIQDMTPFELITIDIHLPEISGIDLLSAISGLEKSRNTPQSQKIMVTASGTKDNLIRATCKGCDGFLVKPVKRDTVDEKMAALGFVLQKMEKSDKVI